MKFSSKILSQTVTQLCLAKGVDYIVISPGSRNAPLTIGFTEHPSFKNFSIVDERCAAFFALGMAQQLKKPVALVCTSGSALLNYYPAISEAFYSDIPLVVLSADRPTHLVDIGDGQTIRQEHVFANHILYNANCKEGKPYQDTNELEINKALNTAIERQGPVHINIPFSEPLYETVNELQANFFNSTIEVSSEGFSENLNPFLETWNKSAKKIILVGVLPPHSLEQEVLNLLATDESVIVLTETTSNLHHNNFFPSIDQLIAPLDAVSLNDLRPDVLLTFGGMVVSKKIKAFLRNYPPKSHWHIDTKKAYNTYFVLNHHFKTTPNTFLNTFLPRTKRTTSTYQSKWLSVKKHRLLQHNTYEKETIFSDFKVFASVFKSIPNHTQLQLSNSTTIRYAQLFKLHPSLHVFCNRGTSGIDGSMSTAIGAACISETQTVFVTGDLSFLYDSNGLWNNYIPKSFRVIIINNSGGGIFSILPHAKNATHFYTYFETTHQLSAKQLCEMHHLEYASASDKVSLEQTLNTFYSPSEKPKLLEVFTPSSINDEVLRDYFKHLE